MTHYLPHGINATAPPSSEWIQNNGCQRKTLST